MWSRSNNSKRELTQQNDLRASDKILVADLIDSCNLINGWLLASNKKSMDRFLKLIFQDGWTTSKQAKSPRLHRQLPPSLPLGICRNHPPAITTPLGPSSMQDSDKCRQFIPDTNRLRGKQAYIVALVVNGRLRCAWVDVNGFEVCASYVEPKPGFTIHDAELEAIRTYQEIEANQVGTFNISVAVYYARRRLQKLVKADVLDDPFEEGERFKKLELGEGELLTMYTTLELYQHRKPDFGYLYI